MRKIEQEIYTAVRHGREMHKGNTAVTMRYGVLHVYLHGNHIAAYSKGVLRLDTCGWVTATTRSRMNAVLDGLCVSRHVRICGGRMQLEGRGKPVAFDAVSINAVNGEVMA